MGRRTVATLALWMAVLTGSATDARADGLKMGDGVHGFLSVGLLGGISLDTIPDWRPSYVEPAVVGPDGRAEAPVTPAARWVTDVSRRCVS